MALVKAALQGELIATYGGHSPDPMKPGKDIAKAFKNYLMMAQNAGGFPASNVVDAPTGMTIGGVYAQQLPSGAAVATQIASALSTMALTFLSAQQIGPPAVSPSHTPEFIQL